MVGEGYGWANSHRNHWVGLFHAGVQLLPTFTTSATMAASTAVVQCGAWACGKSLPCVDTVTLGCEKVLSDVPSTCAASLAQEESQ